MPAERRERLILAHLPQVRLIARRIQGRLPEAVSLDDLISAGIIGLISAIDHFDPKRNTKLKTYAEYKIRGAILDSLRGLDWAPTKKRRKARQIDAATAAAGQRLLGTPGQEEIARELNLSLEEIRGWLVEIQGLNRGGPQSVVDVADKEENLPSRLLERSDLRRLLAEMIAGIPLIERTVLSLYYQEGWTLRQIGQRVRLHESRISQLKTQAILRLRAHVVGHWPVRRGA